MLWRLLALLAPQVQAVAHYQQNGATTAYPLFAIANSRNAADWSAGDIEETAQSFALADGIPIDPELLSELDKASPAFRAVRYCNPRGIALTGPVADGRIMPLDEFEMHHRAEATFFTAGFLAEQLSATSTLLSLGHPLDALRGGENRSENHCALRDWLLVASDPRSGNISTLVEADPEGGGANEVAFVAYLLLEQELMKVEVITGAKGRLPSELPFDTHPPEPVTLRVQRGLSGTKAVAHPPGTRVLAPVSLDDGLSSNNTKLQWAVGMSSPLAHELLVNYTVSDLRAGLGGSWFDNFGSGLYNGKTSTGCGLRTHELFDSGRGTKWDKPSWLKAQAARFAAARAATRAVTGKQFAIVANGYGGTTVPNGSCEVAGACASLSNMQDAFADGKFVDGWILEGFFGNEEFGSRASCGPGGTVVVHDADTWRNNVAALAWAAQHEIPVWPIIFQAGCKSPTLEYQADAVRYALEMSAYASFLLAVEANSTRPITFGTNAFWRRGTDAKPYARLHPQYHWSIGAPKESYPAEQLLAGYVLLYTRSTRHAVAAANHSVVYGRQFENGFAIYNSGGEAVREVRLPGGPYLDPQTNATGVQTIDLDAQSGRVLLRQW